MLSHLQLFDLEGSFVIIMCENVNIEIVKKESTSLVQTGYDKTRNCGENRLKIEADSFPSSLICDDAFNMYSFSL